jgi:aminoglycoside 6'-N-acetyltransferase I
MVVDVTIRPVESRDREEWLRMRLSFWPGDAANHSAEIDAGLSGTADDWVTLIAELPDGTLCGFLEVGTRPFADGCDSSPVGYIEGWWVDPSYRRCGVGARLVAAAEAWARELGLSEMASDADLANRPSRDAHSALGYAEVHELVCFRKVL